MKPLFLISVFVIGYTYIVYPLIIILWGTLSRKRVKKVYRTVPVSVVLAVKNERERIEARIRNLLEQEYPREMVEIIVVSNGSTDGTAAVASSLGKEGVKVLDLAEPIGKAAAINRGIEEATHDIVVFADARQDFSRNALAELVSMFSDDRVGAVSGELVLLDEREREAADGVNLYWRYEKLIRRKEGEADSIVGATGSIYAIRKGLFESLPRGAILDDLIVPMRVVLRGYRVVFNRSARAFDRVSRHASQEFERKVRTLAGNFQAMRIEKDLLNPGKNRLFFQFVSHKAARLFVPYFCVLAFVSNWFLEGAVYRIILVTQVLFYGSILLRLIPSARRRAGRVASVAWTFVLLNAAAVVGMYVFLTGKEERVWRKSQERSTS